MRRLRDRAMREVVWVIFWMTLAAIAVFLSTRLTLDEETFLHGVLSFAAAGW